MDIKLQIAVAKKLMLMVNNGEDSLGLGIYTNNTVILDMKNRNQYFYIQYKTETNLATVITYIGYQKKDTYLVTPNFAEFGDYKISGVLKVDDGASTVRCYVLPYFVTINEYVSKVLKQPVTE